MSLEKIQLSEILKYFYIKDDVMYWAVDKVKGYKDTMVGGLDNKGYLIVKLNRKNHRVHRMMYQIYNEVATLETLERIDHIDGNKLNNSKENLILKSFI